MHLSNNETWQSQKRFVKKSLERITQKLKEINEPEYIQELSDYESCRNLSINLTHELPHNKTDLVIKNTKYEMCNIIEFICRPDINVTEKEEQIFSTCIPLEQNFQIVYPDYHYQITSIIIGVLPSLPKPLNACVFQLYKNWNQF